MNDDIFLALFFLLTFLACVLLLGYCFHRRQKAGKQAMAAKEKRLGAIMSGVLEHISGLPLAKGVFVEVYYCPDRIVFKKDGQEIIVSRDKITGIDLVTTNSRSKAMAGAAMGRHLYGKKIGGVIGAMSTLIPNLVISYTSDGKNKHISLDTGGNVSFATKVEKDFRQNARRASSSIEL